MPRPNLVNAETLCMIAKLGSFRAAAERLYTSQPAVSARMRELEQSLGFALFEKRGRRLELTVPARRFVERVEPLLLAVEDAFTDAEAVTNAAGTVRIGMGVISMTWFSRVVPELRRALPRVSYEIELDLAVKLQEHLASGALDELTLTTNGSQLERYAAELYEAGVRRINVSIDTLDPHKFEAITRWGKLDKVLAGLKAAREAGLAVKINCVALKGVNDDEFHRLVAWCGDEGFDLTFIEVMPMGDIGGEARLDQYLPLSLVRSRIAERWTLNEIDYTTGGPARYWGTGDGAPALGVITPMSRHFCASCNRVRLGVDGTLYLCLGQEDQVPLGRLLREGASDADLVRAIRAGIAAKPERHEFSSRPERIVRFMAQTGG